MNEITVNNMNSFTKKLEERIRNDIADLIPDEALQEIIKTAIDRAFFEERIIKDGAYIERREVPWIIKLIKEEINERVECEVEDWFINNENVVKEIINNKLNAGIVTCMITALNKILEPSFSQFADNVYNSIYKLREEGRL